MPFHPQDVVVEAEKASVDPLDGVAKAEKA